MGKGALQKMISSGRACQADGTVYMKLLGWTRIWLVRGTESREGLLEHRHQRKAVGSETAKATEGDLL